MKIDFEHWLGSQIGYQSMENLEEQSDLQIIQALNPKFSKDGNQWCFIYGEFPNDCVAGFGDTPKKAMQDFCHNFRTENVIVVSKEKI